MYWTDGGRMLRASIRRRAKTMSITLTKSQSDTQAARPGGLVEPGFWSGPLGYPQAVLVVCTAFLVGLFYQWKMPHGVNMSAETGYGLGLGGAALVAFSVLRWRKARLVVWLTGVPLAVVSIVAVALVASVGGIVTSETLRTRFGMTSVYSSWPFAMVMLVMLVNLMGVSVRRLYPLTWRNLCFTLNHLGLTIAILGAAMSATGLQRARMMVVPGEANATAEMQDGSKVTMPFKATLKEFTLETFPPVVMVVRMNQKDEHGHEQMKPGQTLLKPGMSETVDGVTVRVHDYLPAAAQMGTSWRAFPGLKGAAPAARVSVTDANGNKTDGWISSGGVVSMSGHMIPIEPAAVFVGKDTAVTLSAPRPKEFRSDVVIERGGTKETHTIKVNEPIVVDGYKLYQVSYNEELGAASQESVLEVVRDRGLPVVYLGLYLLLAGAAVMLWNGVGAGATLDSPGWPGGPKSLPSTREGKTK
jgi:hypothetical protein